MTFLETLAVAFLVWCALSLPFALALGRALRALNDQPTPPARLVQPARDEPDQHS